MDLIEHANSKRRMVVLVTAAPPLCVIAHDLHCQPESQHEGS